MRLREAKEWIAGGIHKCCGAITVYLVWARTSIEPGAHACRLGHHRPLLQSLFCSVLENLAAKTWWRIQKERRARSSGGKILLEATRWFGLRPTTVYICIYIYMQHQNDLGVVLKKWIESRWAPHTIGIHNLIHYGNIYC